MIYSWAKVIGGAPKASDDLSDVRFFSATELGDIPLTPLVRRVLEDAELPQTQDSAVTQCSITRLARPLRPPGTGIRAQPLWHNQFHTRREWFLESVRSDLAGGRLASAEAVA